MRLPPLRSKDVIKVLKKLGYIEKRQTGSHKIFLNPLKKKIITVPIHNKDLKAVSYTHLRCRRRG